MYVSRLDRPWAQTPFPLQGFYIQAASDIKELTFHCKYVYIDTEKGRSPVAVTHSTSGPSSTAKLSESKRRSEEINLPLRLVKVRHDVYQDVKPLKKEISLARAMHNKVTSTVNEIYDQIGRGIDASAAKTEQATTEMVDSVLRNPDAFTWLSRIRDRDEYTWSHSVRSAVWAVLFGRHIGLAREELIVLATGVLLKDIGKVKLPEKILTVTKRNPAQEKLYRTFVEHSVSILRGIPDLDRRVLKVVAAHCERIDGSGFPKQLVGDKIPLLAKIGGIVTVYDEISSPRDQRQPLSPSRAIGWLYKNRNKQFQEQLVVEFIQAIGVYPTGTVVELSTGDIGVVVEQNFQRRLRPIVAIVKNSVGKTLDKIKVFDMNEEAERRIVKGEPMVTIKADIEPSNVDIDIGAVRDCYMELQNFSFKRLFGF